MVGLTFDSLIPSITILKEDIAIIRDNETDIRDTPRSERIDSVVNSLPSNLVNICQDTRNIVTYSIGENATHNLRIGVIPSGTLNPDWIYMVKPTKSSPVARMMSEYLRAFICILSDVRCRVSNRASVYFGDILNNIAHCLWVLYVGKEEVGAGHIARCICYNNKCPVTKNST